MGGVGSGGAGRYSPELIAQIRELAKLPISYSKIALLVGKGVRSRDEIAKYAKGIKRPKGRGSRSGHMR